LYVSWTCLSSTGVSEFMCRTVIELNLRSASYLIGSKSFQKLKRACETVFKEPQVFLFTDLTPESACKSSGAAPSSASILPAPSIITRFPARNTTPNIEAYRDIDVPFFLPPPNCRLHGGGKSAEAEYHRDIWRESSGVFGFLEGFSAGAGELGTMGKLRRDGGGSWAMEVYEYFSILTLPSGPADRAKTADKVDPYLSTYTVDEAHLGAVTKVRFVGLLPAKWIDGLWNTIEELLDELPEQNKNVAWAGMAVHGFENVPIGWNGKERGSLGGCGDGYTLLHLPKKNGVMTWKLVGGQDEHS
jgi:ribonuclease P/MRP protein subunit RPP40